MRLSRLAPIVLACACSTTPPAPSDDAGIDLPDVGPDVGQDAALADDASDGICGDAITIDGWVPVPASCQPLCSAAARDAYEACATGDTLCQNAAFALDTSGPSTVTTSSTPVTVSCAGSATGLSCRDWQAYSCDSDNCHSQYLAYVACGGGSACTAEETALLQCEHTGSAYTDCLAMRVMDCFPAR